MAAYGTHVAVDVAIAEEAEVWYSVARGVSPVLPHSQCTTCRLGCDGFTAE